jgi:hypothetical protein
VPAAASITRLLSAGLRRDPNERPSMKELLAHLRAITPELASLAWPLAAAE